MAAPEKGEAEAVAFGLLRRRGGGERSGVRCRRVRAWGFKVRGGGGGEESGGEGGGWIPGREATKAGGGGAEARG